MMLDCLPLIHLAAVHAVAGYNSDTLGLGLICQKNSTLASIGRYRNSVTQHSNYALVGYQPVTWLGARWGAFAGMVNGYPHRNGGYFPMGGIISSIPLPLGELHIAILPKTAINPVTAEFSVAIKF